MLQVIRESRIVAFLNRHASFLRWAVLLLCVFIFARDVSEFYAPKTGFSSFIIIGDKNTMVKEVREAPHFTFKDSFGYDGQAYVQLAVHPLLGSPELKDTVDNLPYRARRIFIPWVSYALGLGHPAWIIQVYALINVASWFLIAWLLLRWLPPTDWENVLRWACIVFACGLTNSVRCALTDGPGLLLLLFGITLLEKGRLKGALGVFGAVLLCRETLLLGVAGGLGRLPDRVRGLVRSGLLVGAACLPLVGWILVSKYLTRGIPSDPADNFALPLSCYFERWGEIFADLESHIDFPAFLVYALCTQVALTVQFCFFVFRWRPSELWWRIGIAFSVLLACLGTPVWEGYPGAAARVLLPMVVAFNLSVPKGRRWLAVVILGNLTVVGGFKELDSLPAEPVKWSGDLQRIDSLSLELGDGWYGPERVRSARWMWGRNESVIVINNQAGVRLQARIKGNFVVLSPRSIRISRGAEQLWQSPRIPRSLPVATAYFELLPGRNVLTVTSDCPGVVGYNGDERNLAFAFQQFEVELKP